MNSILALAPKIVWQYFYEITQIPRPSKKEEKIIAYLEDFAKKQQLACKKDSVGNILIIKPATKGMENVPSVLLQSHVDMVCEKNNDTVFNFETDPIEAYVDGAWVKAKGTTLGADNGIGMAAQLAVLASTDLQHGRIECLFTVDEETGLTGAFALQSGFFSSEILLNLDSEDDGEIFIGCAGGIDSVIKFKLKTKPSRDEAIAFKVSVKGLKGGHSGDEIDKSKGNSNKILNRFLWEAQKVFDMRLAEFNGGNLRNAIPREAFAIVTVVKEDGKAFKQAMEDYCDIAKKQFGSSEPNLTMTIENVPMPERVLTKKLQKRLLNSLYACPHGVLAMSHEMPGLVETSTNLASVKFDNKYITVTTSQRSSIDSAKVDVAAMVRSVFELADAKVKHGEGYPGWAPNTNSPILEISRSSYERLFKINPKVRAIHAGLECGLFLEKYPELDMVSIGPTIKGPHSPDERVEIETVDRFWKHLVDILKNIPAVK
ncbi:MAG TPA: cytosol nonspecific dipeptidase [Bacteroidales bacterium]|nr:cytosol nonspecific dipeptidase [Bacteroidales bacterium]